MKKISSVLALSFALSSFFAISAFAGSWQQTEGRWWYGYDDGSYPVSQWVWIDGDDNGEYECYYFDGQGYLITNTHSPDGYYVDANGAWVDSGTVQKKDMEETFYARANRQFRQNWIFGTYECHNEYLGAIMTIEYASDSGQIYVIIEGGMNYSPYHLGSFDGVVVNQTGNNYYAVGTGGDYIRFTYNGSNSINITDSIIEHDSGARFRSFEGNYLKIEDGFES